MKSLEMSFFIGDIYLFAFNKQHSTNKSNKKCKGGSYLLFTLNNLAGSKDLTQKRKK